MSDLKKNAIPSWQRSTPIATASPENKQNPTTDSVSDGEVSTKTNSSSLESSSLVETALKFLEDPSIRNEPRAKKVEFLKTKGLSDTEIEKLPIPSSQADSTPDSAQTVPSLPSEDVKSKKLSIPTPRDIPPIVTYPEFLTQSTKPPPLITLNRLANIVYATSALTLGIYGLSKFVAKPMSESLTDARQDFAAHILSQLSELNRKLEKTASVVPPIHTSGSQLLEPTEVDDEVESVTSDPTELFHRDFGTQTSPSLSRRNSASTEPSSAEESASKMLNGHTNRMKIINSHLSELLDGTKGNKTSHESVVTQVNDLRSYLTEMSYSNIYYPSIYGNSTTSGKSDEMEKLKSEIRSVKGVLLSAKNFPSGGRFSGR
ncbi:hypothetical protein M501DRAFT_1003160 [Patellaria atrata CBS 101060]|uniref:Peroxisomal membrane protein PEX14 n=1 Tax=Patellaria atrata CBS 101060 TaxID=1346257 RepID=A0A9P4VRT4_9PEZI|nr:hypothetical protein M501DRAFT_1003160 [Patellaria atrata CBS 101060]